MARFLVESFSAAGGPETAVMGGDGFERGPTDPGEYLIAYCGRHQSKRYPDWSGIPWGTPLKEDKGELWVKMEGTWQKLSKFSRVTKAIVEEQHLLLYNSRTVPKTWVFNDFGHLTCFFYKDLNGNRKLDGKEKIHGEFFHTTPDDEARTALGLPVNLEESHGCIHLKPADIDVMHRKGYLQRGNRVVVHKYTERTHNFKRSTTVAKPPFELHCLPTLLKVFVVGQAPY